MTSIRFSEQECRSVRSKLDSYLDNELLTESSLEVVEHFRRCADCAREAEDRRKLRERLQSAVRQTPLPAGLEGRVRDRLREKRGPRTRYLQMIAIAATVAICFSAWFTHASNTITAVLRIGLGDHLHCAVGHRVAAEAAGANQLPVEYRELLDAARAAVPREIPLVLAHECKAAGRRFVHLTFRNDRTLLSVVITRKQEGETLGGVLRTSGDREYQIAGMESRGFLVYTVSDLPQRQNRALLEALAPSIEKLLKRMTA
jgi:anti-sigma factor RsiW